MSTWQKVPVTFAHNEPPASISRMETVCSTELCGEAMIEETDETMYSAAVYVAPALRHTHTSPHGVEPKGGVLGYDTWGSSSPARTQ